MPYIRYTVAIQSVEIEPVLQPLSGESITGNVAPDARLDVSAIGFWRPQELILVDVRVFDPNCKTYSNTEPEKIYERHERQKKAEYNDRVINVERATLTPSFFLLQEVGERGNSISQALG